MTFFLCDLKRSHFQLINSDITIDLIFYNINHVTLNLNYAKGYALLLCKNNVPRPISKNNHSFFLKEKKKSDCLYSIFCIFPSKIVFKGVDLIQQGHNIIRR